jgi:hypothetical protein
MCRLSGFSGMIIRRGCAAPQLRQLLSNLQRQSCLRHSGWLVDFHRRHFPRVLVKVGH